MLLNLVERKNYYLLTYDICKYNIIYDASQLDLFCLQALERKYEQLIE